MLRNVVNLIKNCEILHEASTAMPQFLMTRSAQETDMFTRCDLTDDATGTANRSAALPGSNLTQIGCTTSSSEQRQVRTIIANTTQHHPSFVAMVAKLELLVQATVVELVTEKCGHLFQESLGVDVSDVAKNRSYQSRPCQTFSMSTQAREASMGNKCHSAKHEVAIKTKTVPSDSERLQCRSKSVPITWHHKIEMLGSPHRIVVHTAR